ncbi:LuxR C-terminal-related transcriptional regulator [Vineibacter terrae]|nr:response regulator transcription factor [Vineibacter terrae]
MAHRLSAGVISTALIGPNSLFREGLKRTLHPPYQVKTVSETIDFVQKIAELDLVILVADADQADLPAQVRRVKEQNASARVVVISDIDTSEVLWPLLVASANGYLLKTISLEALLASLDIVMLGGTVVLPTPRNAFPIESTDCTGLDKGGVEAEISKPSTEPVYKKLTDREMEILLCLTKGASNKQIARTFSITEATVKVHLKAILRKIRVSNRTQAAVWAHHNYVAHPTSPPQTAAQFDEMLH